MQDIRKLHEMGLMSSESLSAFEQVIKLAKPGEEMSAIANLIEDGQTQAKLNQTKRKKKARPCFRSRIDARV